MTNVWVLQEFAQLIDIHLFYRKRAALEFANSVVGTKLKSHRLLGGCYQLINTADKDDGYGGIHYNLFECTITK